MPAPRSILQVVRKVVAPSCPFASGHRNAVAEALIQRISRVVRGRRRLPLPIRLLSYALPAPSTRPPERSSSAGARPNLYRSSHLRNHGLLWQVTRNVSRQSRPPPAMVGSVTIFAESSGVSRAPVRALPLRQRRPGRVLTFGLPPRCRCTNPDPTRCTLPAARLASSAPGVQDSTPAVRMRSITRRVDSGKRMG